VAGGVATRGVQVLPLVEAKKSGRPGAGGEVRKTVAVSAKQDISFRVLYMPRRKKQTARLCRPIAVKKHHYSIPRGSEIATNQCVIILTSLCTALFERQPMHCPRLKKVPVP
jgi:hypothetical protein